MTVAIAFDRDSAGDRLADQVGALVGRLFSRDYSAVGKDWNECLQLRERENFGPVVRHDSAGRDLAPFRFCGVVPAGSAFVATRASLSFDSRYFGPGAALLSLTVVVPLWTYQRSSSHEASTRRRAHQDARPRPERGRRLLHGGPKNAQGPQNWLQSPDAALQYVEELRAVRRWISLAFRSTGRATTDARRSSSSTPARASRSVQRRSRSTRIIVPPSGPIQNRPRTGGRRRQARWAIYRRGGTRMCALTRFARDLGLSSGAPSAFPAPPRPGTAA